MIKNEFYNDDFEELLKEKADQFSMYPSKRVWHSIYNNLHPGRRWPSMAIGMLLITSLLLIGHLNTGTSNVNPHINNVALINPSNNINSPAISEKVNQIQQFKNSKQQPDAVYTNVFADVITNETDFQIYTVVKNNRPYNFYNQLSTPPVSDFQNIKITDENPPAKSKDADIVQSFDPTIKANIKLTDIKADTKRKSNNSNSTVKNTPQVKLPDDRADDIPFVKDVLSKTSQVNLFSKNADLNLNAETDKKISINAVADDKLLELEEKAWIENYALLNKKTGNKFKGRLSYQFYATPAVNYRKLTTKSKGSATPFASADINEVISQKPGLGIETGLGFSYTVAKNLQIKAGLQFNYTNYNIDADKTNHPIITTILMNDPATGYSYSAVRTSTISNNYSASALQPVTLHNRTYQISFPVGFAYKLSSETNVDWFAGATIQPTYVFGGNAHLISSDLKSYVSDPSSIRTWNLNLGFETYMNFKLNGAYNLQVGPQVRYQVYSTYRKNVALIEKPYAVGLKFGLTKGF